MKKYPLIIEELMGCDYIEARYSKGHHSAGSFCEKLCDYERDSSFCKPTEITHEYWRWIPTPRGAFDMTMQRAEQGKRGAFPVTVLWRDR